MKAKERSVYVSYLKDAPKGSELFLFHQLRMKIAEGRRDVWIVMQWFDTKKELFSLDHGSSVGWNVIM